MFNLFVTKAKHNQLLKSFYKKCDEVADIKRSNQILSKANTELHSQIAQLNNRITVAKAALNKE